eukprot:CAMPEP_0170118706 /NCGR_PEP_ID=MMETSP0020_2-20130122/13903_1 /TAXON_ID=98059 /ORGANISM="Dinobryon sp., Strain UTEXLB2267" /LENGTH=436 /DNA_ID=CAMNT_0010347823 /DNA_START=338 /DNA_END=1648 /DNA_ORIENTATION=-
MACSIDPADPSLLATVGNTAIETARNAENDISASSRKSKRSILTSTTVAASTAVLLCCNCQSIPRSDSASSLPAGLEMSSSSSSASNISNSPESANRNASNANNSNVHCYLCEKKSVHSTAKHCRYCDKCVKGFDHHCKWLNTCIGSGNYFYFLGVVFSVALLTTEAFTLSLTLMVYSFASSGRVTYSQDYNAYSSVPSLPLPALEALCVVSVAVYLPMLAMVYQLTGFHLMLLWRGETTYDFIVGEQKRIRDKQRERERLKDRALRRSGSGSSKSSRSNSLSRNGSGSALAASAEGVSGQGLGLNSSSRSSGMLSASLSLSQSSMDQKDSSLMPLEAGLDLHHYEERPLSFGLQDLQLLRSSSSSQGGSSNNISGMGSKGRSPPSTPQQYSLIIVDTADSLTKPTASQHYQSGGSDDDVDVSGEQIKKISEEERV